MVSGQFVVVRVGVHHFSVSPNTSHPMLQICSKLLHGNSTPILNSSYIQLTPTQFFFLFCFFWWGLLHGPQQGRKGLTE